MRRSFTFKTYLSATIFVLFFLLSLERFAPLIFIYCVVFCLLLDKSVGNGFKQLLDPFAFFCAGVFEDGFNGVGILKRFCVGNNFILRNKIDLIPNDSNDCVIANILMFLGPLFLSSSTHVFIA